MATISNLVVNMIARTANFEAGMKRSKESLYDLQKSTKNSMSEMANVLKLSVISRVFSGIADGVTEYHKAQREGNDALAMFVSKIPLLGRMSTSLNGMVLEVSGLTEELKNMADIYNLLGERNKQYNSLERNVALSRTSGIDTDKLKALYEFQDGMLKIDDMEAKFRKTSISWDLMPDFGKERAMQLEIYWNGIKKINDELTKSVETARRLEFQMEQTQVWEIQKGILNQITDMENRMRGMSEPMVDMLSKMREIGAPFEDIQNTIKDVRKLEETQKRFDAMKDKGGLLNKTKLPDRDIMNHQLAQEINPSLINVAALYPAQDPLLGKLDTLIALERSRRNGELS